jgi:outer membrane protein OmpA-like peptidoglycan-associated protein
VLSIVLSLFVLAGCGQTIVLMPDLDGSVGKVVVTARSGETVTLDQANQAVTGKDNVFVMSEKEVTSTFGEALAAQPEPTAKFILYFLSDSTSLISSSVEIFPQIMKEYEARESTDVSVIGHSDAVGDEGYNYRLSVRRAEKIKRMLVDNGMEPDVIQTTSHGEENPLVPAPDNRAEPRNRRVEVLIR